MGWSIRKSFKFGALRINLSNSGVSGSFGVKGARISVGKRGTYVNLGANGIHYRQRIGSRHKSNPVNYNSNDDSNTPDVDGLTDANSKDFIDDLQSRSNQISLLIWLGVIPSFVAISTLLFYLDRPLATNEIYDSWFTITRKSVHVRNSPTTDAAILRNADVADRFRLVEETDDGWVKVLLVDSTFGFIKGDLGIVNSELASLEVIRPFDNYPGLPRIIVIASSVVLIAYCIWLAVFERKRKTLELYYQMDDSLRNLHEQFLKCFLEFASSSKIWSTIDTETVTDRKYHAGAGQLISRAKITSLSSDTKPALFLKTNVQIPHIGFGNMSWYFFPERLVVKANDKFAALKYQSLRISTNNVRFVESDIVPQDASIVDYTWKYLNKNGGPDQRFADNPQLPICLYTEYNFQSDEGLSKIITTSKPGAMNNFVSFINAIGIYQSRMNPS